MSKSADVVSTEFGLETSESPIGKVMTVLYKPKGSKDTALPTIFYTNRGGWILEGKVLNVDWNSR